MRGNGYEGERGGEVGLVLGVRGGTGERYRGGGGSSSRSFFSGKIFGKFNFRPILRPFPRPLQGKYSGKFNFPPNFRPLSKPFPANPDPELGSVDTVNVYTLDLAS